MENINQKTKSKVLQQLIDMMDEQMVGELKSKSPKFAKVDIQSDDPELAENLKDKMLDGIEEKPMDEEIPDVEIKEDEENPEDIERLLALYKQIK